MAVSKTLLAAALVFGLAASPLAFANEEVIGLLTRNAAAETTSLGEKNRTCEQLKSKRPAPAFDTSRLSELGLERRQALAAITFLGLRNDYLCDGDERKRLAYALGLLENALHSYGTRDETIGGMRAQLVYPDKRYFELAVEYQQLPQPARDYLEEVTGRDPFDAVRAMNVLPG